MYKKVIIIGDHPLANDLMQQYEDRGLVVVQQQELLVAGVVLDDYEELCLLADKGEDDQVVADSFKKFLMMWVDSFSAIYEMRSRDRERIRELEHKLGLFLNKKD